MEKADDDDGTLRHQLYNISSIQLIVPKLALIIII